MFQLKINHLTKFGVIGVNMGLGKYRNKQCPCGSGKKLKKCHVYPRLGLNAAIPDIAKTLQRVGVEVKTEKITDEKA